MNILPNSLYSVLIIITSIWAIIAIGSKIIYAMSHDNMNYQEYVWGSKPPTTPSIDTSNETGTNPWFSVGSTCVAQECCDDGFTYVPSPTNKCVANDKLPAGVLPYILNTQTLSTPTQPGFADTSILGNNMSSGLSSSGIKTATNGLTTNATNSVASVYNSLSSM